MRIHVGGRTLYVCGIAFDLLVTLWMKPVLFLKSVEIIIFRNYNGEQLKELAFILATILIFSTILKHTHFDGQAESVCMCVCV